MPRVLIPTIFGCLLLANCIIGNDVSIAPGAISSDQAPLDEVQIYPSREDQGRCLSGAMSRGGSGKILLINATGVIDEGDSFRYGAAVSPGQLRRILTRAAQDDDIDAILLSVNSPGGSAAASDLYYSILKQFKEERKIPVYAHITNLGASGGYYIAMAADGLNADPLADVGSIGVIIRSFGFVGLLGKLGVEYRAIASGGNKDMLSPFSEIRPEQRALLDAQVQRTYERFLAVVLESRSAKLTREQLLPIADGRVLDASEALRLNLIDSVGYLEEHIERIKTMRAWENVQVVAYVPRGGAPLEPNLYNITRRTQLSLQEKLQYLAVIGPRTFLLYEGGL
ncbi:MAG: signal peptide peptidase SppA [Leptospirales bacterium]|nr:signal peptide peptidase SppA [Leptospirales bacterium]